MPIESPTDLTPELVPLSWLIGEWEGRGRLGIGCVLLKPGRIPVFIRNCANRCGRDVSNTRHAGR